MRGTFLPALMLALAIAAAGWFVGEGFIEGRGSDRYVTVKGISEREVEADTALWDKDGGQKKDKGTPEAN